MKIKNFRISNDHPKIQHDLTADYWNVEAGYNNINQSVSYDSVVYPFRATDAGAKSGLSIKLFTYIADFDDNFCRNYVTGFKVLLHSPVEVPQISKYYFRVPTTQNEVTVAIKPNIVKASERLRKYRSER